MKGFADRERIYLPNTALRADLMVSLAKMKTHHWAGATLSMKNFFGLVPGAVYGWPKNELHQVGIPESIVELNRIFHKSFAIVDGIVGMEGNGPIQGTPKQAGVLVMGGDLAGGGRDVLPDHGDRSRARSSICRWRRTGWGLPKRLGSSSAGRGSPSVRTNFQLIKEFQQLRLA